MHSPLPVHPHERGEYGVIATQTSANGGSSPRTWGIRAIREMAVRGCRFIPTNVGNTCSIGSSPLEPAVHPHERGEYTTPAVPSGQIGGSSPRTWGIRLFRAVRGFVRGSSPRTWGILTHKMQARFKSRFIPTNVGNTGNSSGNATRMSVHPHERGEYQLSGVLT